MRAVQLLVRDLDEPSGLNVLDVELSTWPGFIMSGLLPAQPHDYAEQLAQRRARTSHPLPVKRVVDLIDREPAGDLWLTQLSDVAGVRPRTLQRDAALSTAC
jgi:hypothetical protein